MYSLILRYRVDTPPVQRQDGVHYIRDVAMRLKRFPSMTEFAGRYLSCFNTLQQFVLCQSDILCAKIMKSRSFLCRVNEFDVKWERII